MFTINLTFDSLVCLVAFVLSDLCCPIFVLNHEHDQAVLKHWQLEFAMDEVPLWPMQSLDWSRARNTVHCISKEERAFDRLAENR